MKPNSAQADRGDHSVAHFRENIVLNGALTVGVPLGCVAGISVTVATAKWLPLDLQDAAAWHSRLYYLVFVAAVAWALARGASRAGAELLWAAASSALIPLASLTAFGGVGWSHGGSDYLVDCVALLGACGLALMARAANRRALEGPRDSIWSADKQMASSAA